MKRIEVTVKEKLVWFWQVLLCLPQVSLFTWEILQGLDMPDLGLKWTRITGAKKSHIPWESLALHLLSFWAKMENCNRV